MKGGRRSGAVAGAAPAAQVQPGSGRKPGMRFFPGYGPMSFLRVLLLLVLPVSAALAQGTPAPAPAAAPNAAAPAGENGAAPKKPDQDWRDTSNYIFPAIAKTVTDMQNVAYAMTLRDYCADRRVPDDFVRDRLKRFSAMTGREENCRSLMDY